MRVWAINGISIYAQVFGSKVRVDSTAKVAELELAEKVVTVVEVS